MAEPDFYVDEYGDELTLVMPFDPTGYIDVRLVINRPGSQSDLEVNASSWTSTAVKYIVQQNDLPVAGVYYGRVVCTDAARRRDAAFSFRVR